MRTHFHRFQKLSIVTALICAPAFTARPAWSDRLPQSSPSLLPNPFTSGLASPSPVPLPFKVLSTPDPNSNWATLGILISPKNSAQAPGFARYAADQLSRNGRWPRISLFVFTNANDAEVFRQFQKPRRGQALQRADFVRLMPLWRRMPVYFEKKGNQERIFQPKRNPRGWWRPVVSQPGYGSVT